MERRGGKLQKLGPVVEGLLKGRDDGFFQKVRRVQAVQRLYALFDPAIRDMACPFDIRFVTAEGAAKGTPPVATCLIYYVNPTARDALVSAKESLLRALAEEMGSVLVEEFAFRQVSAAMLKRQIRAIVLAGE